MAETLETSNLSSRRLSLGIILAGVLVMGAFAIFSTSGQPVSITGCNSPASLEQCGTGSCQPLGAGFNSCVITVTFNPAFAATPKFATAQVNGCHSPECHFETQPFPLTTLSFQSDNGETWTSMPVAKTEIYANTNHEVALSTTAAMVEAAFSIGCLTGSSSGTAVLRPEFSTDGGGTWTELAQNPGALDILVDSGSCSFSASPAFTIGPVGMNPAVVGATAIFRVVGINGGGVGDNPVFNNLELTFEAIFGNQYQICIQGASPFICNNGSTLSKTSMAISVIRMAPAISGLGTTISVNWMASE